MVGRVPKHAGLADRANLPFAQIPEPQPAAQLATVEVVAGASLDVVVHRPHINRGNFIPFDPPNPRQPDDSPALAPTVVQFCTLDLAACRVLGRFNVGEGDVGQSDRRIGCPNPVGGGAPLDAANIEVAAFDRPAAAKAAEHTDPRPCCRRGLYVASIKGDHTVGAREQGLIPEVVSPQDESISLDCPPGPRPATAVAGAASRAAETVTKGVLAGITTLPTFGVSVAMTICTATRHSAPRRRFHHGTSGVKVARERTHRRNGGSLFDDAPVRLRGYGNDVVAIAYEHRLVAAVH